MMNTYKYILTVILASAAVLSCEKWPDRQVFEGSALGVVTKYYELPETQTETHVDVIANMQYDIISHADWLSAPVTSDGRDGFKLTCQANDGVTRIATVILAIEHMHHYDTITVRQSGTKTIKLLNGSEEGTERIAINSELADYELEVKYHGNAGNWISDPKVEGNDITFTYQRNDETAPRIATIVISYTDAAGNALEHGFDVLQYNNEDGHVPVVGSAVDLTADGKWANCYILGEEAATVYSVDAKYVSGSPISNGIRVAELLWETVEGTVDDVVYDPIDSKLYFTKKEGAKGNAVVVLKDNMDRILWSYHLWAPGEALQDVVIGGVTFMDRNIGAMTSGAPSGSESTAVGMHYQWGRKDPFPPAKDLASSNGVQSDVFPSDAVRYTPANEGHPGKPLAFAIENPSTYIWGSGSSGMEDWSQVQNDSYWSFVSKTDYDPCPYGYIVPGKEQLQAAMDRWASAEDATKGKNITCDDNSTNYWVKGGWYRRSYNADFQLANVGSHGYYWTSTAGAYTSSVRGAYASQSQTISVWVRRWGANVRCVKIKQ